MKPTNKGSRLRKAALLAATLLMLAVSVFLVAVYRQVQENRTKLVAEFAGFINISTPTDTDILTNILGPSTLMLCESREPVTVRPEEYKLSIWARLRYAWREEWSEASRQVLQNLANGHLSGDKRPATSP